MEFPSICESLIWAESNKYALIFRSETRTNEGKMTAVSAVINLSSNGQLFGEYGDVQRVLRVDSIEVFRRKWPPIQRVSSILPAIVEEAERPH